MDEIIYDRLNWDGMREVKIISDSPVSEGRMLRFVPDPARDLVRVRCYDTAALKVFYGEAIWPAREVVDFHMEGWPKFRRFVVWKLTPGERISQGMECAAERYFYLFLRWPRYAFIRTKPAKVDDFVEVQDVMLLEADWALPGCLALGG